MVFCRTKRPFCFTTKLKTFFMRDVLFVMDFLVIFSSINNNEDVFFLCALPIFDNSGRLKVFISCKQK